jgi:hypothetical protein
MPSDLLEPLGWRSTITRIAKSRGSRFKKPRGGASEPPVIVSCYACIGAFVQGEREAPKRDDGTCLACLRERRRRRRS